MTSLNTDLYLPSNFPLRIWQAPEVLLYLSFPFENQLATRLDHPLFGLETSPFFAESTYQAPVPSHEFAWVPVSHWVLQCVCRWSEPGFPSNWQRGPWKRRWRWPIGMPTPTACSLSTSPAASPLGERWLGHLSFKRGSLEKASRLWKKWDEIKSQSANMAKWCCLMAVVRVISSPQQSVKAGIQQSSLHVIDNTRATDKRTILPQTYQSNLNHLIMCTLGISDCPH